MVFFSCGFGLDAGVCRPQESGPARVCGMSSPSLVIQPWRAVGLPSDPTAPGSVPDLLGISIFIVLLKINNSEYVRVRIFGRYLRND